MISRIIIILNFDHKDDHFKYHQEHFADGLVGGETVSKILFPKYPAPNVQQLVTNYFDSTRKKYLSSASQRNQEKHVCSATVTGIQSDLKERNSVKI